MNTNDIRKIDLADLIPDHPETPVPRQGESKVRFTRIQVPVFRRSMFGAAPEPAVGRPVDDQPFPDLGILRLECMRHRNLTEMRGVDLLVDIERARRAVDTRARIGVVLMLRDPAAFDAINFPGQVETFIPYGRSKKFDCGHWLVELLCLDDLDGADAIDDDARPDDEDDRIGTFASAER